MVKDEIYQRQMRILVEPTDPSHAATKNYVDNSVAREVSEATETIMDYADYVGENAVAEAKNHVDAEINTVIHNFNANITDLQNTLSTKADKTDLDSVVRFDDYNNINITAGTDIRASIPNPSDPDNPESITILATDNNGNITTGSSTKELNFESSIIPTVVVGNNSPQNIVLATDLDGYITEREFDEEIANVAPLVNGTIPPQYLPPGAIERFWGIGKVANLITLTEAQVGNHAVITDDGTATGNQYVLSALPPTVASNWILLAGDGTSGVRLQRPVWVRTESSR